MSQVLSERAKQRLKIVAALLRGNGRRPRDLGLSRDRFYEDLQALLATLPADERQTLKELTDWIEAYDNASISFDQQALGAQGAQRAAKPPP